MSFGLYGKSPECPPNFTLIGCARLRARAANRKIPKSGKSRGSSIVPNIIVDIPHPCLRNEQGEGSKGQPTDYENPPESCACKTACGQQDSTPARTISQPIVLHNSDSTSLFGMHRYGSPGQRQDQSDPQPERSRRPIQNSASDLRFFR